MSADKNIPSLARIGECIKAVRIKRGMTQSELAGGDVTRNMLSRIENGAALPSLPTLCAIAARLDVPVGALLGDFDGYSSHRIESDMRELLSAEKYAQAIEYFDRSGHKCDSNGIAAALAQAYIGRAEQLYSDGELTEALSLISHAENLCGESDRTYILRALILQCPAIDSEGVNSQADRLREIIFDRNDTALYLYCLSKLGDIAEAAYSQPHENAELLRAELMPLIAGLRDGLYKSHILAKLDMVSADYLSAKSRLLKLVTPDIAPALTWSLYTDLEFCCKCCGDFENAYKYSGLRLELIKKIK